METLVHAVHLLQQREDLPPLPVRDVLVSLMDCDATQGSVSAFLGPKYALSWGVDDLLGPSGDAPTDMKESADKGALRLPVFN